MRQDRKNTYFFGLHLVSSEDYRYILNAHGDVVALVNASGTVTKRYEYDAFGNELTPDESDTNPYRYCAEYFDKETGTIYLRARYYNPAHGRFTQLDSAMDGLNWYVYCANNPILFVDPWGRLSISSMIAEYNAGVKMYNTRVTMKAIYLSSVARGNGVNYALKNGMYKEIKHTVHTQGEIDYVYTREPITWDNATGKLTVSKPGPEDKEIEIGKKE